MVPDVARSPKPAQQAPRSPFGKFGGRKHPSSRSVSDPFGGPSSHSASKPRRSSFSSSPERPRTLQRHAKKSSTLPSIRSLKTRIQSSLGFGGGGGSKGPKILRGEEAKAAGVSAPQSVLARTGGGLKGFSGPAGSGIGRSVSHPAKLQDAGKLPDADAPTLPQVGFSGDVGDYGAMHFDSGTKRSVDKVLSAVYNLYLPTTPRSTILRSSRSQWLVSIPGPLHNRRFSDGHLAGLSCGTLASTIRRRLARLRSSADQNASLNSARATSS
jgi:hypothetical protein